MDTANTNSVVKYNIIVTNEQNKRVSEILYLVESYEIVWLSKNSGDEKKNVYK